MRIKYKINGIVQGVGFRPTVYKIAKELDLKGYVLNSSDGVIIEIEGENQNKFIETLKNNLPPLARIDTIEKEILERKNYTDFEIIESKQTTKTTSISPDIAICDECLKEMFDKNNRRYLFPFINCTNCGPRYTIIKDIPYDRKNTSMAKFKMCEKCYEEYTNPLDRRYHAEPTCCFECGPELNVKWKMENGTWKELRIENGEWRIKKIELIAEKIKEGKIVAIKGLGGFHLVCNATNEEAVKELRRRKQRPTKPFAMMFKDLDTIKEYCDLSAKDTELITSKEKPIVLVKKRVDLPQIADGIDRYGVFLPYTPVHYLLFEYIDFPIVATSANISDEPIIRDSNELVEKLGNVVDYILDNDRDIINACDDSVVQAVEFEYITMRCARGYAPLMKNVKFKMDNGKWTMENEKDKIDRNNNSQFSILNSQLNILGVGANQKNTISLSFKDKFILSPHIGDLGTIGSIEYFERTIDTFRRLYDFEEDVIICDKHPYYESTKWALKQNKKIYQIQHHYAHALATMFEYDLEGDYLAFIFDGTGYGDDGTIWGGEVFIANRHTYERVHYFKQFKLIGGEKAVKNPANMAVALLDDEIAEKFKNRKLAKNLSKGSFPLTSSMGRIFDMVAYLAGMIERNEWEGMSGLLIEKYYNPEIAEYISLADSRGCGVKKEIDFVELLNFAAKNRGDFELVSSVFINSIANCVVEISEMYDLDVILGGGVFQNKTLLSEILKRSNKKIYFNKTIPINDGGISVGQTAWGIWNL
ncbi:[NiFe] hydrogenase maturation protein HypF [Nautilia profundicola AmH]|uniref:Carbamoyltransferase n=1 Tax=Nautilia profundicola (strain ATCC BAA-1463 / DSM 18972 / AmH) TaxID=598659 RepID=B9L8N7_NAUPA|nr:carbamoyltransferase HypF [Nautilia profundicola]ACM93614.1 [NiFe] hydrogenase maturation protein HypF [Nautilia profundicola AmH]